jgi:hypothetical protein
VDLLGPRPKFEIDYASSNEEVAIRALQYLDEEATQDSKQQLGLNLSTATALLKALTVTSSMYLTAKQTLSAERAEALQRTSFHLHFQPMTVLTADDSVQNQETEAYDDLHQLNIAVKLLNGQIKQFTNARPFSLDKDARDFISARNKASCCAFVFSSLLSSCHNPLEPQQ